MRTRNVPKFRGEKPKCREMSSSQSSFIATCLLPSLPTTIAARKKNLQGRSANHESGYDSGIFEFNKQKNPEPDIY